MRKVTEKAAHSLLRFSKMTSGNTRVTTDGNYTARLWLHGNCIATYRVNEQKLELRDAGWTSATTKERLNGVLSVFSSEWRIYQREGVWYITDGMGVRKDWTGNLTIDV